MKRIALALATVALFALSAGTASADPRGPQNPSRTCVNNSIPSPFGPFEIPSHGGCTSTVATGGAATFHLTTAAYVAQCQMIRATDPGSFYGTDPMSPYNFGGTIGSCAKLLRAYHEGTLPPPGGGE